MIIQKETKNKIGIYCFYNKNNNKRYIGSSVNIHTRLQKHRSMLRHNKHENQYLQNSYNKHGEKQFLISILEYCSIEKLTEREQFYIDLFDSEYNIIKDVIRRIPSKKSTKQQGETRKKLFKSGLLLPNCAKTINVYNLEGKKINTYPSIIKATKALNVHRSSITGNLSRKTRKVNNYIFINNRKLTLQDLIFPIKGNNLIVLHTITKKIYFRSQARCASYLGVPLVSIEKFLIHTKRILFKNKYKIDLIKSCELLETLEADNQQPSSVEIH